MNNLSTGLGSLKVADDEGALTLNLFDPVERETSFDRGRTIPIYPLSSNTKGPFNFQFPEMEKGYIALPTMRVQVEGQVVNIDGTDIADDAAVSVCNMLGPSLFSSLQTTINGKLVPELSTEHLNFKTYIESMQTFNTLAANTHLKSTIFELDQAGKYNHPTENKGLVARKKKIVGSRKFQSSTFLCSNWMSCERLFPSFLKLGLTLHRTNDDIIIMKSNNNTDKYKINITDIKVYVRYVDVSEKIFQKHMKLYENMPMLFPLTRSEIKQFSQPANTTSINIHNLYTGALPKSILIFMLKTTDFTGDDKRNPYNFQHFDCEYASLSYNGEIIPQDPYRMDFSQDNFVRVYRDVFDLLSVTHDTHLITESQFKGGHFLIPFSFSPDQCFLHHIHPSQTGTIGLELRFKSAVTNPITILAYSIFDSLLSIEKKGMIESHDI